MTQGIQAKEEKLEKVFSNDYSFQIPYYQRPYAWTCEETEALLDDICAAGKKNPESPYFLGSIVLNEVEKEGRVHFDVR